MGERVMSDCKWCGDGTGDACAVCREHMRAMSALANPPEPAAPIVGTLIIDPTPLRFRGFRGSCDLDDDEPAAPRYDHGVACPCGACAPQTAALLDLDDDDEPAAPAPDEAELDTAASLARVFLRDVLGHRPPTNDVAGLARILRDRERAAEARGRERGIEEAARECEAEGREQLPVLDAVTNTAVHIARRIRALLRGGT